ncbi:MAG: nitrogenase component 1 [Elusimicrobiota bacterium]|jgi:nitrogenase molybdenum-iron protein alpha/beta subunit
MSERLGIRIDPPYLHGAFLALNAVSDAYFLGDGPDCIRAKAEQIHGRHDLFSTLLSCKGEHRVHYTGVDVFKVAANIEDQIVAGLRKIAARPHCAAVFMGSIPMCTIVGTDYERILREVFPAASKPAFLIPPQAGLSGDWLDGYAAVLLSLAKGMDLSDGRPKSGKTALVGHFMGRNEGDGTGNIRELERILRALDLDPVSVWLSGGCFEALGKVRDAETIISLPHGRKAGRVLAERLKARLIEAEAPFGLSGTKTFVETLGRECGREDLASAFIRRELSELTPRLEWLGKDGVRGRRFAFAGDPHYAPGFAQAVEEVGGRVFGMILTGFPRHLPEPLRTSLLARPNTAFAPFQHEVEKTWFGLSSKDADALVGTTMAVEFIQPAIPWVEFGYPSDYTHFLKDEPFLGFKGALRFLTRLANANR